MSLDVLETAIAAAEAKARSGDWSDALRRYAQLLKDRLLPEGAADPSSIDATTAWIIERTADLATVSGQPAIASKLLPTLWAALSRSGNRYAADLIATKRLHVAVSLGDRERIDEALNDLRATIGDLATIAFDAAGFVTFESRCLWADVLPHERAIFFVDFYRAIARLFTWLGQHKAAAAALHRALIHAPATEEAAKSSDVAIRFDLAVVALACGDIADARRFLADVDNPAAPIERIRHQELLGRLALLAGAFADAQRAFADASELSKSQRLVVPMVTATLNLCYVLVILNQTVAAERRVSELAGLAATVRDPSLATRVAQMQSLIQARRSSGSAGFSFAPANFELWMEPAQASQPAAGVVAPIDFPVDRTATLVEQLGEYTLGMYTLFQGKQFATAAAWLDVMFSIFGSSDSPLITLRLQLLKAMATYYRGDHRPAAEMLDMIVGELRQLGLRHDLWLACCFRLWCEHRLHRHGTRRRELLDEVRALTQTMSRGLPPAERAIFELNKWNEEEAELAARVEDLARSAARAPQRGWLARAFASLRTSAALDRTIASLDARRRALIHSRAPASWRKPWWLRLCLVPRDRLTLSFLVLPDRLVVIRESFLRLDFAISSVTRLRLRELVKEWHESVAKDPASVDACADQLGAAILLPELLGADDGVEHLRVVPDDVLCGFPFAALRCRGQRLVERTAIALDTSHVVASTRGRASKPNGSTLIAAMGLASAGLGALPGVASEAESITKRLRAGGSPVTVLRDEAATPAALVQGIADAAVAHVACHGVFEPDAMERTGLLLYGSPGQGLLSLLDLAQLDLRHLQLMTLSSCWSADNYILTGRNIVSLPQVIRAAGARSVLSCLWAVDDQIAVAFFDRFYALSPGLGCARALRQVQLEFIERRIGIQDVDTAQPYFWAGFTLHSGHVE